jgi:hypothetical protein
MHWTDPMSYTLAFYAAPLDELTARIEEQGDEGDTEVVVKRAVEYLRELGTPVDAVDHGSAGGEWFRDHFVEKVLGGLIGRDAAVHLVERPLAGTQWSGYPSMGWLTRDEVAAAVAALDAAGDEPLADADDPESEELLELVNDILHMAAETGQDVVTVYS